MPRYSLSELIYWQTVWIVGVSLIAVFGAIFPFQLLVLTAWFLGTVVTNKLWHSKVSLVFSISSACAICLLDAFGVPAPPPTLNESLFAIAFSGVVGGSLMWFVVAAADGVFKHFSRRSP